MNVIVANSLRILSNITKITSANKNLRIIQSQLLRYSESNSQNTVTEEIIKAILQNKFPASKTISVEDVSGGCGAMFNVYVESNEFKGLSIIKQHRSVYDVLKDQIKSIHGIHLETKVPP